MNEKDRADRLAARCASQMDKIAEQDARIKELEGALQDILAAHANDNIRPKAFYIASSALANICSVFVSARAALKGE